MCQSDVEDSLTRKCFHLLSDSERRCLANCVSFVEFVLLLSVITLVIYLSTTGGRLAYGVIPVSALLTNSTGKAIRHMLGKFIKRITA